MSGSVGFWSEKVYTKGIHTYGGKRSGVSGVKRTLVWEQSRVCSCDVRLWAWGLRATVRVMAPILMSLAWAGDGQGQEVLAALRISALQKPLQERKPLVPGSMRASLLKPDQNRHKKSGQKVDSRANAAFFYADSSTAPPFHGLQVDRRGIVSNVRACAALKGREVNWRQGPGKHYPVLWTYKKAIGWPVIIERHKNHWYLVRDIWGSQGWVQGAMMAFRPTLILLQDSSLLDASCNDADRIAHLQKGVVVTFLERSPDGRWFYVRVTAPSGKWRGWIHAEHCWPRW